MEHFDTIYNSPSHIYHFALPFCPSSSWLCKCYSKELSQGVKVVKGLPAEWGTCSRTVSLSSSVWDLSYWNNTIAIGSNSRDIIILNAITGSQIAVLSGHTDIVWSVTYSPDGVSLVSGSQDKTVKLWDVQTGGVVKTFYGHTDAVHSVSISADRTRIASGSLDCTVCLWDIQTGNCYHIIKQEEQVHYVGFFPTDPQHLLSISNFKVWKWDINGHQVGSAYDCSCVSFSPDGTWFVSCKETTVTVQNSSSGVIEVEFQTANHDVKYCCFSLDSRLVAVATGNTIYVWDISSSSTHFIETIAYPGTIYSLAFSSPSSLVSAVTGSFEGSIKFLQIGSPPSPTIGYPKSTFPTSDEIRSITLQAKDDIIITGHLDGVVKTWDILTGLCKSSFQTPVILGNQSHYYMYTGRRWLFNQDIQLINGRLIIAWYKNQMISAWDVERGEPLFTVDRLDRLWDLKISEDGSRVYCLNEVSIQALSVQTGEIVGKVDFSSHFSGLLTIDGSRIWVCLSKSEYQGWNFGTPGSLPVQLPNIPPHKLHPNGTMLWNTGLCRIEDKVTGKVVFQLPERYGEPVDVQWNGQYLVACFLPIEVLILDFSHIL